MAKNLSFSHSKMSMYKECPQKYKFRYVHMLPEKPKYFFAFGTALHSVMEFIYNPEKVAFPTLKEALSFFEKEWNKTSYEEKGYASLDKELAGYAEGRQIIETYYSLHSATFVHPLLVEMKSTLEMDGLNLVSILDRMDYLGGGLVKILDYKTGKTVQREPDQLYMYQKVVENSPVIKSVVQAKDPSVKEVRVGQLSFYHLPTQHEMTFDRAPDKEIFSFWQRVLDVADDIRAGKFEPSPDENKCRWCDYRNICPVFTGQEYTGAPLETAKKRAVSPKELPPLAQDVLGEKIDRYGALTDEAATLEQEIMDLMQKNNFSRHFGKTYHAQLSENEKIQFTEPEKIVELLRKEGLLQKVLVPTKSTLLDLLNDSSVSNEIKQQIKSFIRRNTTPLLKIEKTDA